MAKGIPRTVSGAPSSAESDSGAIKVLGGGRVTVHRSRKVANHRYLSVFGYSKTYGRCDDCNRRAAELIAASDPSNLTVKYSPDAGYAASDEAKINAWTKVEGVAAAPRR